MFAIDVFSSKWRVSSLKSNRQGVGATTLGILALEGKIAWSGFPARREGRVTFLTWSRCHDCDPYVPTV